MIVRVPVAVDSKAERKHPGDLAEDHKEKEADHKEAEVDRRGAAVAVLDRDSVIVFVRASLNDSPLLLGMRQCLASSLPSRWRG